MAERLSTGRDHLRCRYPASGHWRTPAARPGRRVRRQRSRCPARAPGSPLPPSRFAIRLWLPRRLPLQRSRRGPEGRRTCSPIDMQDPWGFSTLQQHRARPRQISHRGAPREFCLGRVRDAPRPAREMKPRWECAASCDSPKATEAQPQVDWGAGSRTSRHGLNARFRCLGAVAPREVLPCCMRGINSTWRACRHTRAHAGRLKFVRRLWRPCTQIVDFDASRR
jgi:hypothetical protein